MIQVCKCGRKLERVLAVKHPICFDCKMERNREKAKERYYKIHSLKVSVNKTGN